MLQIQFNLNYNHIAFIILISGLFMQFSTFLAGFIIKRYGHLFSLSCGIVLSLAGLLPMFSVDSILMFDVLFILFMFGFGICLLTLNMYMGYLSFNSKGKALMKLHLGASIGICTGPAILLFLMQIGFSFLQVLSLSGTFILAFSFFLIINIKNKTSIPSQSLKNGTVFSNPKSSFYLIFLFIIVLTTSQIWEHSIYTWFVIYAVNGKRYTSLEASKYLTLFLMCFPIIRFLSMKLMDMVGYHLTLFIIFFSVSFLLLCNIVKSDLILISLTGLFTALMYPLIMTMLQNEYGQNRPDLIGFICMVSGIFQHISMCFIGYLGDTFSIDFAFESLIIYILIGTIGTCLLKIASRKSILFIDEKS